MGDDEEKFTPVSATRSVSRVRKVFDKYMTIPGFQIEETSDQETSGNLEQPLAVVTSACGAAACLAGTVYNAIKGAGQTVSRSETDLFNIRREFRKNLTPLFIP